ncbi:MAG TPA: GDSL-type esterase/lipase family protein [Actinocatenispora sp.]
MAPLHRRLLAALGAAVLGTLAAGVPAGAAAADGGRPTAIVSMGDSFISGEGAGDYEPGTDQPGNFCHRSANAEVHETTIAVDAQINLACSGAVTDNIGIGGTPQNGEQPQADHLRQVAKDYDVKLVTLTVGANDVGFTPLILDCIKAYFLIAPRCEDTWAQKVPDGLAAAATKVERNLADIRAVMRADGYADTDYQLVLQSYSSPVTEDNRYSLTKLFHGCPIRDDDADWARNVVVPAYSATYARIARDTGVRLLDLGPFLRGHEACARGITADQQWANGIVIDLAQIRNGLGENIVRQSLHPNAAGHAQMGRCLGGFYAMSAPDAACVLGADGNATAVPRSVAAAAAPVTVTALPRQPEPDPYADPRNAAAARGDRHSRH